MSQCPLLALPFDLALWLPVPLLLYEGMCCLFYISFPHLKRTQPWVPTIWHIRCHAPNLKRSKAWKSEPSRSIVVIYFFFYFFIFFPFDKINKYIDLSKIQVRALWHIYKQYKLQIMCLQIHLTIQCSKKNKHKVTILSKVCNLNRKSRPTTPKANRPQVSNL